MIISHHYRFIFYAIPKTGSNSIRHALRAHLHKYDWEQCSLFEKKYFPIAKIAEISHGHISYKTLESTLWPKIVDGYFSFCFVRDPLDRFLSYCHFAYGEKMNMQEDLNAAMKEILRNPIDQNHILFRPQSEFICDKDGSLRVQFIGRFEKLELDFHTICQKIGLPDSDLNAINRSEKTNQFTPDLELKQMLFDFYKIDYINFNYPIQI